MPEVSSTDSAPFLPASPLNEHVAGASTNADSTATAPGTLRAWHYGNPLVEQSALEKPGALGLVDTWDSVSIRVSGSERLEWLNNLISQKVNAMPPHTRSHGLILDVQGRVEHSFSIVALDDALLLSTDAEHAEALATYLQRMIFWAQVEVEILDEACLTVLGAAADFPDLGGAQAGSGSPTMPGELPFPAQVTHWDVETSESWFALRLWMPRADVIAVWDQLATIARPTGRLATEALRIAARIPDLRVDLDERTIPHEVPAFLADSDTGATQLEVVDAGPSAAAVHLNKGCYRGQETVSRVQNLGKPPRKLVLLHLDGSANTLPAVGSELQAGGRTIGRVGSSAQHSDFGPIALALVKRNVVDKLATDPQAVPPLQADGIDVAIDPADITQDNREAPGRAAIKRLRDTNATR